MKTKQLELLNELPENPGINGRDKYLNSVVLVMLMPVGDEYHFVFQKRASNISQGGEICFPGGEFDKYEDVSLEKAVIREIKEEMGIFEEKFRSIGSWLPL